MGNVLPGNILHYFFFSFGSYFTDLSFLALFLIFVPLGLINFHALPNWVSPVAMPHACLYSWL